MNINCNNNNSNIYFGVKLSEPVEKLLHMQIKHEGKKTRLLAEKQLENIKNWEPLNAELVLARNIEGNIRLGLKYPVSEFFNGYWPISKINGRTILSSVLKLHPENIEDTVKSIVYLYKKHGAQIFDKTRVVTIYDKVRSGQF